MKKGFRILKFKKDRPIFEVKDISKSFDGRPILKKLSIKVFPGECVGILGPNGCGKSTFIKVIFGIATHYSGDVLYNNKSIANWRTDQLVNNGIAYVPQVDNVFPSLSIFENLQMGGNNLSLIHI